MVSKMILSPDQAYLNGLVQNDGTILRQLYAAFFPRISTFIQQNQGTQDDAQDIFQEALMVIYHKAKEEEFELTSAFYTFLYSICKNLWLKELRKKSREGVTIREEMVYTEDAEIEEAIHRRARARLYRQKFQALGEDCQQVLSMGFSKKPMVEIAEVMGYASPEYARKKKFTCKDKLIQMIKSDPIYQELADNG